MSIIERGTPNPTTPELYVETPLAVQMIGEPYRGLGLIMRTLEPNTIKAWLLQSLPPIANRNFIEHACRFAEEIHRGQKRKDKKTPFIVHPYTSALLAVLAIKDITDAQVAILVAHDTIEDDKNLNEQDVKRTFNELGHPKELVDPFAFGVNAFSRRTDNGKLKPSQYRRQLEKTLRPHPELKIPALKGFDTLHNYLTDIRDAIDNAEDRELTKKLHHYRPKVDDTRILLNRSAPNSYGAVMLDQAVSLAESLNPPERKHPSRMYTIFNGFTAHALR